MHGPSSRMASNESDFGFRCSTGGVQKTKTHPLKTRPLLEDMFLQRSPRRGTSSYIHPLGWQASARNCLAKAGSKMLFDLRLIEGP